MRTEYKGNEFEIAARERPLPLGGPGPLQRGPREFSAIGKQLAAARSVASETQVGSGNPRGGRIFATIRIYGAFPSVVINDSVYLHECVEK